MYLGSKLALRGLVFGVIVLILFSITMTTGASPPPSTQTHNDKNGISTSANQNNKNPNEIAGNCLLNQNYPQSILRWCDFITKYAEQYKLPPNLIAAVMWQESGGKPQAYSKSGAVGLMQVMPRDGIAASFKCVNGPCFSNRPTIAELEDPEFNIEYGASMLARLISRHGNLRAALKAYGPMDVGYTYADKVLHIYHTHLR